MLGSLKYCLFGLLRSAMYVAICCLERNNCFCHQITTIKEDVEHYIKSCRDPDFEENDFIYEDLKLEEACAALGSKLAAMSVHDNDDHGSNVSDLSLQNSSSPSPSPSIAAHSKV